MALASRWRSDKEEVVAENGIVTAAHRATAEAGLEMLKRGGNAIDAAVAMGFCSVVVEPYMATIAGQGYMLVHLAAEGKTVAIDFNGRAPSKARPDMFRIIGPASWESPWAFEVEEAANRRGPLAVTVPGTCAGLCAAHSLYGRLPLEQVLDPAIALASDGFEADWFLTLRAGNQFLHFNADPVLAPLWLPNGHPPRSWPKPGDRIVQRDLGDLLRRVAREGADALHRGEVADAIDAFMRRNGGILTAEDLADYQPVVAEAAGTAFQGHTVTAMPTASGGTTALQTLNILDHCDLTDKSHNSAGYLHLFVEAARHAFADFYRFLGDEEHTPVPMDGLLSRDYARMIAGEIDSTRARVGTEQDQDSLLYYMDRAIHDPWAYNSTTAAPAFSPVAAAGREEETTHFSAVDRDRNVVCCTQTGTFSPGASPPSTGVYLTSSMGWFVPQPGYPNSIVPWKRPLNAMAPLLLFRDGLPILCVGSPGGRRIVDRNLQVLLNSLLFGMSPQEALVRPTVDASSHDTFVESRLPEETTRALEALGHRVRVLEDEPGATDNFAHPQAIAIDHETGLLRAGVEALRCAVALGY